MNNIIAIRYIDTIYFTKKKIKDSALASYVAIGVPSVSKDHVTIIFNKEDGRSIRGLLVPKDALILEEKKVSKKFKMPNLPNQSNFDMGIFWKDIVYFENGKVPRQATKMYTEGKFFSQTANVVTIQNPETIKMKNGGINSHPKTKATFFVIPKVLITGVEIYDKKL